MFVGDESGPQRKHPKKSDETEGEEHGRGGGTEFWREEEQEEEDKERQEEDKEHAPPHVLYEVAEEAQAGTRLPREVAGTRLRREVAGTISDVSP